MVRYFLIIWFLSTTELERQRPSSSLTIGYVAKMGDGIKMYLFVFFLFFFYYKYFFCLRITAWCDLSYCMSDALLMMIWKSISHLDIVCVAVVGNNRSPVARFLSSSRCKLFTAALGRRRQCQHIYWWKLRHLRWHHGPTHQCLVSYQSIAVTFLVCAQWHFGDVPRSNIIFRDSCCFGSTSLWISSLKGTVDC